MIHKPYEELLLLLALIHCSKNQSIDFVTRLPVLSNWKSETYDLILVIINRLTKIVYYNVIKIRIDTFNFAKLFLDVIKEHHRLPGSIINDRDLVLNSKFWSLLYYFLEIKRKLFITFYS